MVSDSYSQQDAVSSLLVSAEQDGRCEQVWERLVPLVYQELRALAHAQLAREGQVITLDTTDLVHEAYLRLVDHDRVTSNGRPYFFGAAARAMRQVLVDHARRRQAGKRGGGALLSLRADDASTQPPTHDLVALDVALTRLAEVYPRAAQVVECRFFGGLSTEETGAVLCIASRTVKREWALARAWLFRELTAGGRAGSPEGRGTQAGGEERSRHPSSSERSAR